MGLINWFKDKVISRIEHDLAILSARMEGFDLQIDQLKAQIASVRQRGYKQRSDPEADQPSEQATAKDWEEMIKAFGGVPIELIEKYKRTNTS